MQATRQMRDLCPHAFALARCISTNATIRVISESPALQNTASPSLTGEFHGPTIQVTLIQDGCYFKGWLQVYIERWMYPCLASTHSIKAAITLGGRGLVDGIIILAEHGDYPYTEDGQHIYPRRHIFEQACGVLAEKGAARPIFNDKHLSYLSQPPSIRSFFEMGSLLKITVVPSHIG